MYVIAPFRIDVRQNVETLSCVYNLKPRWKVVADSQKVQRRTDSQGGHFRESGTEANKQTQTQHKLLERRKSRVTDAA